MSEEGAGDEQTGAGVLGWLGVLPRVQNDVLAFQLDNERVETDTVKAPGLFHGICFDARPRFDSTVDVIATSADGRAIEHSYESNDHQRIAT